MNGSKFKDLIANVAPPTLEGPSVIVFPTDVKTIHRVPFHNFGDSWIRRLFRTLFEVETVPVLAEDPWGAFAVNVMHVGTMREFKDHAGLPFVVMNLSKDAGVVRDNKIVTQITIPGTLKETVAILKTPLQAI